MQIKAMKISPVAGAALLAALMTATAPLSYAASDEERAARRAQWESLSTQEREARRQERRDRFEALPEDEQQAMRDRRQQQRAGQRGEAGQRGRRGNRGQHRRSTPN